MMNDQLWQATLGQLELSLSKANFTTWFKNTFIVEREGENVTLGVPNAFTKTWLENKYHAQIVKALQDISQFEIKHIVYKVVAKTAVALVSSAPATTETPATQAAPSTKVATSQGFNKRYTFDSFVVGKKNELAQAACSAVAKQPGTTYNPLFIYGGVGLGKTHLMQAIGNAVLDSDSKKKVLYVTCEQFTNDFIKAIQEGSGKAEQFKHKYRSVDVLLIDDIQFIAGKESTQEEFFHTFNHLHQVNKQIVLTSDRPPKAIPALEERLTSRFEWGMIVDIGPPELETRIAILQQKCKEKGFSLPQECTLYIATAIQNNIRELEGALNKIIAYHQLQRKDPTLESVKEIVGQATKLTPASPLTPKHIITIIANYFSIKPIDVIGSCRKKELVVPRQIAMYLMRKDLHASYPNIGQELGGRDHTTAMHAVSKITKELETNEKLQHDIQLIKQRIYTE